MKLRFFIYIIIISLISILFLFGCGTNTVIESPPAPSYELFTGVVRYPGNLYFPSRVRLVITLNEHNMFDGITSFVVSQTINNPQRFPVNYTLRYLSEEVNSSSFFSITYTLYREVDTDPFLYAESEKVRESELINPVDITLIPY